MDLKTFLATRTAVADLRTIADSPYGENQAEPGTYPEPVAGFTYNGSLAIEGPFPGDGGYRCFLPFEEDSADLLSLELELFAYFAAEELSVAEAIHLGSLQSNLDRALRYLFRALEKSRVDIGDAGGVAAMLFSDCNALESGKDWDALWPELEPFVRAKKLGETALYFTLDHVETLLDECNPTQPQGN